MHNHDVENILNTTINQKSEKKLIYNILSDSIFAEEPLQRLLATYPSAPFPSKPRIIKDIMKVLWKGDYLHSVFDAFDVFLAVSGKRGHFIHQFEVYILGLSFIKAINSKSPDVKETFGLESFDQVARAWLITSAAHDFGYPIESSSKIFKELSSLYGKLGLGSLEKKYGDMQTGNVLKFEKDFFRVPVVNRNEYVFHIDHYVDLEELVRTSIVNDTDLNHEQCRELMSMILENDDHGYASSVLLCQNIINKMLTEMDFETLKSHWMFEALKKSISSIALHSLKLGQKPSSAREDFIAHISFDKNPFSYILFLVDNIQDWDRNLYHNPKYAEYILTDCAVSDSQIYLKYLLRHDSWSPEAEEDAKMAINQKRDMIQSPKGPTVRLGIDVKVEFELGNGSLRETIELSL